MLEKAYAKNGKTCTVTFTLPGEVETTTAHLVGEFNGWDADATPMKRAPKTKGGGFTAKVKLDAGQSYRFRYLLDDGRWENDWHADAYLPNEFGSDDSVVTV